MTKKLTTSKQIANTKYNIGTELWFCSVSGEPEITVVNLRQLRTIVDTHKMILKYITEGN